MESLNGKVFRWTGICLDEAASAEQVTLWALEASSLWFEKEAAHWGVPVTDIEIIVGKQKGIRTHVMAIMDTRKETRH